MAGVWNELSEVVVKTGLLTTFKTHLSRYMEKEGLERHGPNMGSLDGAPWSPWRSWAKRPTSVLYDSDIN